MQTVQMTVRVDLARPQMIPTIRAKQYDANARMIKLLLSNEFVDYTPDSTTTATVTGTKPDGKVVANDCTIVGNAVSFGITEQMSAVAGTYRLDVVLIGGGQRVGQTAIKLHVDPAAVVDMDLESTNEYLALVDALSAIGQTSARLDYLEANKADKTALASEVSTRQQADSTETVARTAGDTALGNRIDNIIASAGDGTIPTELSDMRVGSDGTTTYATAGARVTGEISELNATMLDGSNALNSSPVSWYRKLDISVDNNQYYDVVIGKTYDANGALIDYVNGAWSTVIVPVKFGDRCYMSSISVSFFLLDKDKKRLASKMSAFVIDDIRIRYIGVSARTDGSSSHIVWLSNISNFIAGNYSGTDKEKEYIEIDDDVVIKNIANYLPSYIESKKEFLPDKTNLNDLKIDSVYLTNDAWTYSNTPSEVSILGFVWTVVCRTYVLQIWYQFTGGKVFKRRGKLATGEWESWTLISGRTISYTENIYQNAYNVTATPAISTDVNNYLKSTNDTTDVTASIATMLSTTGICRLGPGVFYVNNLNMPDYSAIIGSGAATKVILIDSVTDGYAIKLGTRCTIKDLMLLGQAEDANPKITVSETVGTRHGIVFEGTGEYPTIATTKNLCTLDNIWIYYFSGGGITCRRTGYSTIAQISATNINIVQCDAGINIPYWSEFHKFTNCNVRSCYYGCINNGGNNTFVNCSFSGNKLGFLMDNTDGQAPNNSHGQAVGCVFDHSDSNAGTGIKILSCDNGYIFSGCQLFFSKIEIENSGGVVFSGLNCGKAETIVITGGGAVVFSSCLFGTAPTITISDNSYVHLTDCYTRDGASVGI